MSWQYSGAGVVLPERNEQTETQFDRDWIVTVFDNETNTYEEVMTIVMLATKCSSEAAYIAAWEIDNMGKSVVFHSSEEACKHVAEIISTIGIHVEVMKEFD